MTTDTVPHIQPYQYYPLPGGRVKIINPQKASVIFSEFQILMKLDKNGAEFRELSAHERIMLETALSVIKESKQ